MASIKFSEKEGITSFQYYFVENEKSGKSAEQWGIFFSTTQISIEDFAKKTKICMKFVEGEKTEYRDLDIIEGTYTLCKGGEIAASKFTLSVYVHYFKNPENQPPQGTLDLVTNSTTTSIDLPYKLALNIIKFMSGSTDVEGVCYVRK